MVMWQAGQWGLGDQWFEHGAADVWWKRRYYITLFLDISLVTQVFFRVTSLDWPLSEQLGDKR
jgi:hypothetical protein